MSWTKMSCCSCDCCKTLGIFRYNLENIGGQSIKRNFFIYTCEKEDWMFSTLELLTKYNKSSEF